MSFLNRLDFATVRRIARRRVARWLAGAGVLVLLLWWVAARGIGMGSVVPWALDRLSPDGTSIEVARVEGSWGSRLRAIDVSVERPGLTVSVPEVEVHYALLPLIRRTIDVSRLELVRPTVRYEGPEAPPREETRDTVSYESWDDVVESFGIPPLLEGEMLGGWRLLLGRLSVADARGTIRLGSGAGEPLRFSEARLATSVDVGPQGTNVVVDSLEAAVVPPGDSGSVQVPGGRFTLVGALAGGVLTLQELDLETERSRVRGSGTLALLPTARRTDRIDFDLNAEPFDLRDVPVELPPQVADDPALTLSFAARGAADSMRVQSTSRGPAQLVTQLDVVVRPFESARATDGGAPLPALEGRLGVSGADLSGFVPPRLAGVVEGQVDVSSSSLGPDGEVALEARLVHRPAGPPTGGLLGRPIRLGIDVTRTDPAADARLSATVEGASASGAQPRLDASGGWTRIARIEGSANRGAARWELHYGLDSASVTGEGAARWMSDTLSLEVRELVFDRFDASRFLDSIPATSVSGRLSADVTRIGSGLPQGRVQVALARSVVGDLVADTVDVDATLGGETIEGRALATVRGTRLETLYDASLDADSVVVAELSRLRVTGLPVEEADSVVPYDLFGRATGRWDRSGIGRRASAEVLLDSLNAGPIRLRGGRIDAELEGDAITGDATLDVRGLPVTPLLVDARIDTRGLAPTDVVGEVELVARRPHLTVPDSADGVPAHDTIAVETLIAGADATDSVHLTLSAEEPGRYLLDGVVRPAEAGALTLSGSGRVAADSIWFEARARGDLAEPADLLRGATIDSLVLDAEGTRTGARWHDLSVQLDVTRAAWRDFTADAIRAQIGADSTGLVVDTVVVDARTLEVSGAGTLPAAGRSSGRLELDALLRDTEPIRRLLGVDVFTTGDARLNLVATGDLDEIQVTTTGRAEAVVLESVGLTGLDVDGTAVLRPPFSEYLGLTRGRVEFLLDRLSLPDAEVSRVDVLVDGGPDSLVVETSALVDDRRRGDLVVRIDPRPDRRVARLERLDLTLDADEWSLRRPATIQYLDGYTVDSFFLAAGDQDISVDGGVDGSGALDVTVHMDSTDIGTLSDLLGFGGLRGWVGGDVRVTGSTDAPQGTAELVGAFHRSGVDPHPARIALESDGRRVTTDMRLEGPDAGVLRLDGSAPLPGGRAPDGSSLDLRLTSESFGLGWALPFLDPTTVTDLSGRLDGELTLAGSMDSPEFGGSMELSRGTARLPTLGTSWTEVFGVVHGRGSELSVDSLRIGSGSGELSATGSMTLSEGLPLDFDVVLDGFRAIRNEQYHATLTGDLRVEGELVAPVIEGEVSLESFDLYLDEQLTSEGLEEVELDEEDLRMLRDRFGYVAVEERPTSPIMERLTADLVVTLGRDSWLRKRASPEMAVAFTGSVNVALRPGATPDVTGSVETIAGRGFVEQFGRRFRLREGTVTFSGPPSSTTLDLEAEYTIPSRDNPDDAEATIVLEINGTQDDLSLVLSSEPPMENADIVSYIATGRPASGTLALGDGGGGAGGESGGGLVSAGAELAVGQLLGAIEGAAQQSVGLDVIEIRREGLREATVVAGKYVSPRLYVGFAQPLTVSGGDVSVGGEGGSEVEIELEALRWLLINVEASGSAVRFFLRGRRAY